MSFEIRPESLLKDASNLAEAAAELDSLISSSTPPQPNIYGKILINSAQMTEPMTTKARIHLYRAFKLSGEDLADDLQRTADIYETIENINQEKSEKIGTMSDCFPTEKRAHRGLLS